MTKQQFLLLALRLMFREMRQGIRGFGVFLACLFLGVLAISAISHFSHAARSGILKDASELLGGDLEIRQVHRPLTPEQRDFLSPLGRLSEVIELRTMAVKDQHRTLVELKAIDDNYPLYGDLKLSPPSPPSAALAQHDGSWGILIAPALLKRLAVNIGDTMRLGDADFVIRGTIEREPDQVLRAFSLGPRVMISLSGLKASRLVKPGSLINYVYRLRVSEPTATAKITAQLLDRFPDAGWRLRSRLEAAPRVSFFLDRMETNLTLLGLCALLVGGLGVTGAVRGYFNTKVTHIAAMKCVGATQKLLFTTYLLQILFLGAVGSIAGVMTGALIPLILSQLPSDTLPLPLDPGTTPGLWITALLFGLLTALLFSLRELGRACRTPPTILFRGYHAADNQIIGLKLRILSVLTAILLIAVAIFSSSDRTLALWFICGALLCFLLFRQLSRGAIALSKKIAPTRYPVLRLALVNIHRPGSPAGGIIFSLGIGLTALVMIVEIQSNLNDMVTETLPADAPAYFFFDIQPQQVEPLNKLVAANPQVTRFVYSPTLRGRITAIAGVPVAQATIDPTVRWAVRGDRFLSYSAAQPASAELVSGRWWPEDYSGPAKISLTSDLAEGFGVDLGDTLDINILGRTITAEIANLRRADWSSLELNFAIIFAPGILESAPQSYIAATHLPKAAEEPFYQQVTETFANVSALSVRETLANITRVLKRIGWAFKGMAALTLVSGFFVLSGAISADQHRRVRDAVILKVCGATRKNILATFAAEFLFLGLIAALVSLVTGSLAAMAVVQGPLNATFQFHLGAISATLSAGILVILLFGLLGTWKALSQKPSLFLRQE